VVYVLTSLLLVFIDNIYILFILELIVLLQVANYLVDLTVYLVRRVIVTELLVVFILCKHQVLQFSLVSVPPHVGLQLKDDLI
jgi:hypothetical protein